MANFVRALTPGEAPGVQLNPLIDNSEILTDIRDQLFAGMLRLTRGRVDKPFFVTNRDFLQKCGNGAKLGKKTNAYKSWVAVFEALKNGASGAVLQRLVPSTSKNKYIVVKSGTSIKLTPTFRDGVLKAISVTNQGTAAYPKPTVTIADGADANIYVTVDKDGAIVGIDVEGGTGYTNSSAITITGSGGSGATATLSGVKNGSLNNAKVTITASGTGYPHPTVAFTGSGTGGEVYVTLFANKSKAGKIKAITVAKGGRDYTLWNAATSPTVVAISGGTGAGATAKVVDVDNGVITAITAPTAVGDYLNGTPRISIKNINGGKGAGAKAVATVVDGDIDTITMLDGGAGYVSGKVLITANLATNPQFILMNALPDEEEEPYLFAIRDLECFNDGLQLSLHIAEKLDSAGNKVENDKLHLRIIDPERPKQYRYEFIGDLSSDGRDDYGTSTFMPDVIARKTDSIEITIGQDAYVHTSSLMYGYYADDEDKAGEERWITSETLKAFVESEDALVSSDYISARKKLISTPLDFAYISSLDTETISIISELANVAYETNKNLRFDVQGDTINDALSFIDSLNFTERNENHLLHAFWTPLMCEDPTRNNGSLQMGAATLNIAFACARNTRKDSKGFAPKHYPIMGDAWPVAAVRKNIRQLVSLGQADLNKLARAKINPVIFDKGNGKYLFTDAITCANVDVSLRKLIAVTDMSTSIDDAVIRFCNQMKGLPIDVAIKKTIDYLKAFFEGAEAAGWLIKSTDPDMGGKSFKFEVLKSDERPYDVFIVNYWLHYQGTTRQIYVTQTYTR